MLFLTTHQLALASIVLPDNQILPNSYIKILPHYVLLIYLQWNKNKVQVSSFWMTTTIIDTEYLHWCILPLVLTYFRKSTVGYLVFQRGHCSNDLPHDKPDKNNLVFIITPKSLNFLAKILEWKSFCKVFITLTDFFCLYCNNTVIRKYSILFPPFSKKKLCPSLSHNLLSGS